MTLKGYRTGLEGDQEALNNSGSTLTGDGEVLKVMDKRLWASSGGGEPLNSDGEALNSDGETSKGDEMRSRAKKKC